MSDADREIRKEYPEINTVEKSLLNQLFDRAKELEIFAIF